MKAPVTDKHLLEMMWERFPEIMKRGVEQPAPVQQGWKLVPLEPTDEMLDGAQARIDDIYRLDAMRCYEAMLAAAPQPAQRKPLTDEQQHRENFESWFRQKYHDRLDRNMPDKSYNNPHANATWIGWRAAHNIKENT